MTLPSATAELLDIGNQARQGIIDLGAALGILQYNDANFSPLVAALQTKQDLFNAARSETAAAYAAYGDHVTQMIKGGSDARKLLSISWGDDWTTEWAQAGWNNSTTEVPRTAGGIAALCASLAAFLGSATNADYTVATAKILFTAARYTQLGTDYRAANELVAAKRTAQGQARENRNDEDEALRKALRVLNTLLEGSLEPLDPRWDQFGFPRPGAKTKPAQPIGLTATQSGTTVITILANCTPVPLATYYRWFSKLKGVDTQFRFLGRSQDPMFQIKGLPAVGDLEIQVEAANEAGPGKESESVTIVLGAKV